MKYELLDFYRGKRVVVVGGAGFVGIQLVRQLVSLGADVIVVDNYSRGKNFADNALYSMCVRDSYFGYDLVTPDALRHKFWLSEYGFDVASPRNAGLLPVVLEDAFAVFNLAATVAGVLHNESHHTQMYDDNIRVLASPLRASEQAGVPHYLQTSSVCVYAEDHQSPCDEEAGWGGDPHPANAGYAEAKRDGERLVQWSNLEHAVIVRPSNIIGPYDYFDDKAHVVPAFIKRAFETEGDFLLYGNPNTIREFIYSSDVASGMLYALAFGKHKEAYNIGTDGANRTTMLQLAEAVIEEVGYARGDYRERGVITDDTKGGGDAERYSNAKKLQALGWKHEVNLRSGIQLTIGEYTRR